MWSLVGWFRQKFRSLCSFQMRTRPLSSCLRGKAARRTKKIRQNVADMFRSARRAPRKENGISTRGYRADVSHRDGRRLGVPLRREELVPHEVRPQGIQALLPRESLEDGRRVRRAARPVAEARRRVRRAAAVRVREDVELFRLHGGWFSFGAPPRRGLVSPRRAWTWAALLGVLGAEALLTRSSLSVSSLGRLGRA